MLWSFIRTVMVRRLQWGSKRMLLWSNMKNGKKNNHLPPPTCFTMSNKKNATIKMEKWIIGWMRVYLTHHSTNYVEYKIKMNNLQCSKYMCEGFIRKLVNESKSLASLRKKHAMNPPPKPSQWDGSDEGPQHIHFVWQTFTSSHIGKSAAILHLSHPNRQLQWKVTALAPSGWCEEQPPQLPLLLPSIWSTVTNNTKQ